MLKTMSGGNINSLLYARKFDSQTKELSTITVQQFSDGQLTQVENAANATWNGQYWIMKNGVIYDLSATGGVDRVMHFDEQALPISEDPDKIAQAQRDPDQMTIKELRAQIRAYEASYVNTGKLEMELYQRFTIPIASFVFALIGAPLGLQPQRSSSSIGFGVSVLIIFIYYGVMTFTGALGKGGAMPTLLAAAMPDLMGVIAGLYLNWRVSR